MSWSPKSTSFAVVYGYMPAKTVIFNAKAQPVHTFPLGPRNTVSFSPTGRLVLVAGFGNLAGQMDIYDLEKDYAKICTVEASNASVCEWSPDGKHILTATTSPRLRVDNGVRIWHVSGGLMYNEDMNELYHVCWRPQPGLAERIQEENPGISPATPHPSASKHLGTVKTPSKPAGAYRPPGARGQVTPLAFKREDEGGAAYVRDGTSSFSSGVYEFGKSRSRVVPGAVDPSESKFPLPPGAAPGGGVSLTGTGEEQDGAPLSKAAKKNAKKREAKKAAAAAVAATNGTDDTMATSTSAPATAVGGSAIDSQGVGSGSAHLNGELAVRPAPAVPPGFESAADNRHRDGSEGRALEGSGHRRAPSATTNAKDSKSSATKNNNNLPTKGPVTIQKRGEAINSNAPSSTTNPPLQSEPQPKPSQQQLSSPPETPESDGNPVHDKKVRGLLKKVRAIEDLKMRLAAGEKLEETQVKKILTEDAVRKDLMDLGWGG